MSMLMLMSRRDCGYVYRRYAAENGVSYMLTFSLLDRSNPDVESTSKRTPRKLKLKAPSSISEKALDSFTPVRSNVTPASNVKSPTQRKPISAIKLNGVGSKVRSITIPESPRATNRDDSIYRKSPNEYNEEPAEESPKSPASVSEVKVVINSASPRAIKAKRGRANDGSNNVSLEDSLASIRLPTHLARARQQANNNTETRYIPNGHKVSRNGLVDSIVSQYDSLVLKGNAVKPQETSLGNSTTRRKPPKLRQQQSPALGRSS